MQPALWPGEAACSMLEGVRLTCDELAVEMQAVAADVSWQSPAARLFAGRVWGSVAEVASVGDLAMQVSYAARAEQEAKGS